MRWSNSSSFSAASARSRCSSSATAPLGARLDDASSSPRPSNGRATNHTAASREQPAEDERGGQHYDLGRRRPVAHGEAPLLARVRPDRHDRAEEEDEPGEPDQVDERVDDRLEVDRAVRVHLLGDQEQILAGQPVRADRDLVRDLLLDRVAVLARVHRPRSGRRRGRRRSSRASRSRSPPASSVNPR